MLALLYILTLCLQVLKASTHTESRDALLREAALVALLQHEHVVGLIGVVTVPRRMPPLLLLTYCEHGELLNFVRQVSPDEVDASMLLTFCADVAAGLSYLSSRRIIHRDVAARNVSDAMQKKAILLC